MTINFESHVDAGSPLFASDGEFYRISCDKGDRGRWLGLHPATVEDGDELRLQVAQVDGGHVLIIWWESVAPWKYLGSARFEPGAIDEIVPVMAGAKRFRVELRMWAEGQAEFSGIDVEYPYEQPVEPPIEPPVEPPIEPHEEMYHIYHLATPDLQNVWTVTISDSGITTTSEPMSKLVDEMAATEPDEPAELLPPDFGTVVPEAVVPE